MKRLATALLLTCLATLSFLLASCGTTTSPVIGLDPATGDVSLTDQKTGVTVTLPVFRSGPPSK